MEVVERKPPVEIGQELDLEIVEVSRHGTDGVGKIEGFIVFVPNTTPGNKVRVLISKVFGRWAIGEVIA